MAEMQLVGAGEIQQLFGVNRARIQQLTKRDDFPQPVADLMMGKVWDLADVRAWAEGKGRAMHPIGE